MQIAASLLVSLQFFRTHGAAQPIGNDRVRYVFGHPKQRNDMDVVAPLAPVAVQVHPIRRLFDAGVKVTVNTDDAIVFGVGVSEEFLRLYQGGVFSAGELDLIRQWGLAEDQ